MTTGDGGVTVTREDSLSERMMMFRDKGWSRQPGWGPRTYRFLAPNYRITELQSAVGLVQLGKLREVTRRRNELGDLLSESIRGAPGVEPPPVTPGGKHTYWSYALRITEGDGKTFAEALRAEGVSAGSGYIGEPIFMCMEALASKETFGDSHHPLDGCHGGRQIDYGRGLCPRTEEVLRRMVNLSIHEHMTREDILDMAGAVRKVAEGLAEKRKA
jgi:dTDP-4-amino-4,6-dideoxygalactose transaminase